MIAANTDLIRIGVDALMRGDFDGVAKALDSDVEWAWFEPGGTDLVGRDAVVQALRDRFDHGVLGGLAEVIDVGGDVVVASLAPSARAAETGVAAGWARISFRDGLVTHLVSYDTRERALSAR